MEKAELIERYGINIKELEKEQTELAKNIQLKDSLDFSSVSKIAAVENILVKNSIISAAIVCNKNFEIIEQQYFIDKLRFPFIHGFNAYREMPAMISALNKIQEIPEVVLIRGEGTNHPRLGIGGHFSLSIRNLPVVSVSDNLFEGNKIEGEEILMNGHKVGKVFVSKQGSRPLYICPGNNISIGSALQLVKKMIVPPHKFPEPLHLAHKYAKEIKDEMKLI